MSTMRTYCEQCGTYRFKPAGDLCWHCKPAAEKRAILATKEGGQPVPSPAISFGGHQVDAPRFTPEQFARAIARALVDELEIHEQGDAAAIVSHTGLTTGYHVTRQRCTCQAGQAGVPCKHRAALIFHLDVRRPAIRTQWDAARKAVAA